MKGVKSQNSLEKGDLLTATAATAARPQPNLVAVPTNYAAGQPMGAVLNPNNGGYVEFTNGFRAMFLPVSQIGKTVKFSTNPNYDYPVAVAGGGTSSTGKKWWEILLETVGTVLPVFGSKGNNGQTPPIYDGQGGVISYQTPDQRAEAEAEAERAAKEAAKKKRTTTYVVVGTLAASVVGLIAWLLLKKKPVVNKL